MARKFKSENYMFLERKDAEMQSFILNTEKTIRTKTYLAVLETFKKISDDGQKIYSRKLKFIIVRNYMTDGLKAQKHIA